jgi:predicted dehydrogenase
MKLRFALLGCGRIARKHAAILAGNHVSGAELAAVCDIVPERARTMGEAHGVPFFTDYRQMMDQVDDLDVVCVLTPSGSHACDTIALAPYGKHLVVEKPMALRVADADDMIAACDRAGIRLFVVKQNRYNKAVVRTKQALDAGRFGRIVMGTVRVRWTRTQEYYDQDPWRGTWAEDGGVFANQASHHVDLLEWMLGEPVSVFAKARTALVDIEVEDTGVAVITFSSGALGVVEATNATRPRDLEGSLSLLGEKGTVVIGGFAVNEIQSWDFATPEPGDDAVREACSEQPPNVYGHGHIPYLEHVVDCISNDRTALVDGLVGRRSLELISAIYESVETGREVFLRFRPEKCRLGIADE